MNSSAQLREGCKYSLPPKLSTLMHLFFFSTIKIHVYLTPWVDNVENAGSPEFSICPDI